MADPYGISEGVKTLSGSLDSSREAAKGLSKSIEGVQHDAIDVAQKQANERIRARREAEFKKERALIASLNVHYSLNCRLLNICKDVRTAKHFYSEDKREEELTWALGGTSYSISTAIRPTAHPKHSFTLTGFKACIKGLYQVYSSFCLTIFLSFFLFFSFAFWLYTSTMQIGLF
jgi:hypothetical protein